MKSKLISLLIFLFILLTLPSRADYTISDSDDFTGEAFFRSPLPVTNQAPVVQKESKRTMPPIKKLRLKIQNTMDERAIKTLDSNLAPTAPKQESHFADNNVDTSKYASDERVEEFDDMVPDGFEADEEAIVEKNKKKFFSGKKSKHEEEDEDKQDVILDCDNVDYDTPNYLIKANGNVNINFVNQKTTVKCDSLVFDRINNTIKAEGNVKIIKSGNVVTGDYIFVDLNEENALIENPITVSKSIEIRSKKGYVYGDKIVQEDGNLVVRDSYPIDFSPGRRGPKLQYMLKPQKDQFEEDLQKGVVKLKAETIKVKQKGDLEVIAIKRGKVSKGSRTIFKVPAIKIYTNKNHDYAESNIWEVGYYRGLGVFTGPGWVFELPKGSVFKAMPILNYNEGFGVGAMGRFSSGTNQTTLAYGSASNKFFALGEQRLDDNLTLIYGMNSFMDEWFLGRRRPKHGVGLVYDRSYSSNGFLVPHQSSSFTHRLEAGYYHDLDFDSKFEKVRSGGHMGTTRFRYMAQAVQSLFNYRNEEKLTQANLNIVSQLSTALYGTGDTQVIGMIGPHLRLQYKRWMQDIGYNFVAYDDNTPMRRFDSFRYGTQYLYLREYLRLCNWLTVSWFSFINTTNDSINGKTLQENTFYFSFGPDDFKFHIGYDFARELMRVNFEVLMDAKGTNVEYKKFELTQDKKANKDVRPVERKTDDALAPTQPRVLQRAVVENVKVMEDVL